MRSLAPHLLLSLPLALALVGRAGAHSATEPVPRPDDGWKRRQASLNENAERLGSSCQVVFIGDSITQGWEGAGKEVWDRYYAPRKSLNLGIGGDRTQHVLWRLDNGNLKGVKPKAAVLMIGTNNSNGEDNTIEQIADGIAAIVRKLRDTLPDTRILLLPIFPRSENPSPQRGKILQVNQIVQKLADNDRVLWVDFGHQFLRSDGTIPADLMPDYLHLSPKGYQLWADAIEPVLAKILGELPAASAASAANLSGDWVLTIPGPNQDPVDLPFTLQQSGASLTGSVARFGGGPLEIRDGKVSGSTASWRIVRDRSDGSTMTYEMTGTIEGGAIKGTAKTTMDGNPITIDFTAKRR